VGKAVTIDHYVSIGFFGKGCEGFKLRRYSTPYDTNITNTAK
jgi:hypothetical protein